MVPFDRRSKPDYGGYLYTGGVLAVSEGRQGERWPSWLQVDDGNGESDDGWFFTDFRGISTTHLDRNGGEKFICHQSWSFHRNGIDIDDWLREPIGLYTLCTVMSTIICMTFDSCSGMQIANVVSLKYAGYPE